MARKPLLQELLELRPEMAAAAQKVYDDWTQDAEGVDPTYGTGGICDDIAEAIADAINSNLSNVDLTSGGQDGDDHAWVIAYRGKEAFGIDISPGRYERGGGYCWRKIPGVSFDADDITVFKMDMPEGGFEMGVSEGGTNIQGNRFEADVSRNKQRADIKDRKISRLLHTLNREDVQELHDLTAELLGMMEAL